MRRILRRAAAPSRRRSCGSGAGSPLYTSGSGPYYIEFRSRFSWDYGHTYIVHGRVGEAPTHASVAGLSPVGDDSTAWVIGHYVPVPAETGWTDGDLEDKYVTSRYRVLMNKEQYDRVMTYVRDCRPFAHLERGALQLQRLRCRHRPRDGPEGTGFDADLSEDLHQSPAQMNTNNPNADETLVSDNVKEMSNPTRDGRAMIVSGVHTIHPDGTPATDVALPRRRRSPASTPKVSVGAVRVSSKTTKPGCRSRAFALKTEHS